LGKIRTTKWGYLYFDFFYKGIRCREYTRLKDTLENRKKLERIMKKIEAEMLLGTFRYERYFPDSPLSKKFKYKKTPLFKDFAWDWYEENELSWKPSTKRDFKSILKKHLIPYFGEKELGEIEERDVKLFRKYLSSLPGKNGNKMSNKRINNVMVPLKLIMKEASKRFGIENPCEEIEILPVERAEIHPFSLEEMIIFLKGVRKDFKNYYIVRFLTGMRTGEIDGLLWKYVDFINEKIMVRKSLSAGKLVTPKTESSIRDIDMLPPVKEALLRQKKRTYKKSDFVFCNKDGNPLDHNNVTKRIWYPTLKRLGLPKRAPYQTRHTAATLWLAAGENPEWVAKQLGHSSTEMLFKVYSKYIPNLTRKDGSAFMKVFEKAESK
jgi:integrase